MSVNFVARSCSSTVLLNLTCMHRQIFGNSWVHSHPRKFSLVANPSFLSGRNVSPSYIFLKRCITRFSSSETDSAKIPLTKQQANDLVLKLTEEEQKILLTAIQTFQSEKMRQEFQGQLAGWKWRSKLGRPTKLPKLGDTDPTGSFCPMPEDWLTKKYAEAQPAPAPKELALLGLHNALPFIGFGFLDNLIMIVAGDYIDLTLGLTLGISTMAAAALGNTISDVAGIGSAWYVENLVTKFGFKPPALSPIQLDMKSSRRVANMGRAIGVSLGCLLGMLPLLFLPTADKAAKENAIALATAAAAVHTKVEEKSVK